MATRALAAPAGCPHTRRLGAVDRRQAVSPIPPAPVHGSTEEAMSLQQNLIRAERAVKYVESILRDKACNRPEDLVHQLKRLAGPDRFKRTMATGKVQTLEDLQAHPSLAYYMHKWKADRNGQQFTDMRTFADAIRKTPVGNCMEHAVLAAVYLKFELKVAENVFVVRTDENGSEGYLDHVFVLIDAEYLDDDETENYDTPLDQPPDFGPHAVVCDPWYHEWYSVQQDWCRKMGATLRLTTQRKNQPLPAEADMRYWPA